ncbi:Gas vesicle synthesis protein GvpL/GvpF [Bacillus sp. THAF10]|uniref:GvpL/GvpF family gas vesicle protein n=1 Tax=Bacillus sp. THAF10 TaxID=2587848 RepID=UPI0012696EEF|nr:GvpL/GvpF family gas vesicle protein [Bacillus sp. THAF10]QFT90421.1 Gas vesicle synthesis protein GvpL/GvpF [Bacillus sp. THAF10]
MNTTKTMHSLFYLYGLVPSKELETKPLESLVGIDNHHEIFTFKIAEVTALICEIDENEFSEQKIEEKVKNDMKWLEEKAFHHHETINQLHQHYTVIPLKFCTIYKTIDNLTDVIEQEKERLQAVFQKVARKEEWNIKIFCEEEALRKEVAEQSSIIKEQEAALQTLTPGRQFFEKKKLQKLMDEEVIMLKRSKCESIHDQLKNLSAQAEIKKNWTQDMTGKKQDMNWNAVYLISTEGREEFTSRLEEMQQSYKNAGFTIEWSGPWPCYHFANL